MIEREVENTGISFFEFLEAHESDQVVHEAPDGYPSEHVRLHKVLI
jgi:hypothetical protein